MPPGAEQIRDRHADMLAQQVEHRRLDRGLGVDRRAQVKGLQTPPARIARGKGAAHLSHHTGMSAEGAAHDQPPRILQRLPDRLAAGHFA